MLPDRVLNPGPLTYESGALPIALRGKKTKMKILACNFTTNKGFLGSTGEVTMVLFTHFYRDHHAYRHMILHWYIGWSVCLGCFQVCQ